MKMVICETGLFLVPGKVLFHERVIAGYKNLEEREKLYLTKMVICELAFFLVPRKVILHERVFTEYNFC